MLLSKEVKTNIMEVTKTKFGLPAPNSITESSEDLRGAPTKETFGTRSEEAARKQRGSSAEAARKPVYK